MDCGACGESVRHWQNARPGSVPDATQTPIPRPEAPMIRTYPPRAKWLVLALLLQAGCSTPPPRQRVEFVEVTHRKGTNLPAWAACWFPHRANPAAVVRAQPCPSDAQATTAYTAQDLNGCWLLTDADGNPPTRSPFFSAPIRLTTESSPRLRERGLEDTYAVQTLAHIPDRQARDTILLTTYWEFSAPDSVDIIRSTGYSGVHLSFRVRGDSLIGMGQGFWDVIEMSADTAADPVERIRGRRVRCSPPHEPVTTASAGGKRLRAGR